MIPKKMRHFFLTWSLIVTISAKAVVPFVSAAENIDGISVSDVIETDELCENCQMEDCDGEECLENEEEIQTLSGNEIEDEVIESEVEEEYENEGDVEEEEVVEEDAESETDESAEYNTEDEQNEVDDSDSQAEENQDDVASSEENNVDTNNCSSNTDMDNMDNELQNTGDEDSVLDDELADDSELESEVSGELTDDLESEIVDNLLQDELLDGTLLDMPMDGVFADSMLENGIMTLEIEGEGDDALAYAGRALVEVSGTVPTYSIQEDTEWYLTGDVILNKRIDINNGATLTITGSGTITQPGSSNDIVGLVSNGASLMVIGDSEESPIVFAGGSSGLYAKNNCTTSISLTNAVLQDCADGPIYIQKNSSGQTTICDVEFIDSVIKDSSGGAIRIRESAQCNLTFNGSAIDNCSGGGIVVDYKANVNDMEFINSTISNCNGNGIQFGANVSGNLTLTDSEIINCSGNAVQFGSNAASVFTSDGSSFIDCDNSAILINGSQVDVLIQDSTIDNCKANAGSAIYFQSSCTSNAVVTNSIIKNCNAVGTWGGTIRTEGAGKIDLLLNQCVLKDNKSSGTTGSGAAVYWNACGTINGSTSHMTIQDCQFIGNEANYYGGAIYNEAFMTLQTAYDSDFTTDEVNPGEIRGILIKGNSAYEGGGIHLDTYNGGAEAHAEYGAELSLETGMFIIGNSATNGGGVAVHLQEETTLNKNSDNVKFQITCDGAMIKNNTATENGGGICMIKSADYFPGELMLNKGTITGNRADNGGAVALTLGGNVGTSKTYKTHVGIVGQNDDLLMSENTANEGGAVYINGGDFEISAGHINNNTANEGGAVYINGGDFEMNDGEFDSNCATNNGGALYVHTIDKNVSIDIYDGKITNNTSGNHGGAIEANAENDCEISLNVGLSNCCGNSPELHSTSGCPEIANNHTSSLGGAFCLHGGKDKLSVNIYCGEIAGNIAFRNPGSNSLNQGGGTVSVYGGDIDAGIMIGGGSYDDKRLNAKQVTIRFWANYQNGPTTAHTVEVTNGVTVTFPLDTYTRNGHILSGWSTSSDGTGLYVPTNGHCTIDTENDYLDFYAVWDVESSYVVYIPTEVNFDANSEANMDIKADVNYFKKNSLLSVRVNSDFELQSVKDTSKRLPYKAMSNDGGQYWQATSGDTIATFEYDYTTDKNLLLQLIDTTDAGKYSEKYTDVLTFIVEYSEVDD